MHVGKHNADDTRQMVASQLGVAIDTIDHIGTVETVFKRGYTTLCNCQNRILYAVTVHLTYLLTIRDGDGTESFVLQGKCPVCEKVYVAEGIE